MACRPRLPNASLVLLVVACAAAPAAVAAGCAGTLATGGSSPGASAAPAHASPRPTPSPGPPIAVLASPPVRLRAPPLGQPIIAPRSLAVPILRYHVLGDPPPGEPDPYRYLPTKVFVRQMRYLVAHGYQAVTLQQVYDFWHGRGSLPARPIVLSFDDGYFSDFATAAPLLKSLHWPGVLNVLVRPSDPYGPPPLLQAGGARPDSPLPEACIRALIRAGWEIDAHSLTHPDLRRVSASRLVSELAAARAILRRLYHVPVNFFCYPRGLYDKAVIAAVRRAGYLGATTTDRGLAVPRELYRLKRIGVTRGEGLRGFAASLLRAW